MAKGIIVTIDGPAGSGKSTAARALAKALGYRYLDTGATYRALAMKALKMGVDPDDTEALRRLAESTTIDLTPEGRVWLDGEDVTERIRDERVGMVASLISRKVEVREILWEIQRRIGREGGVVAEGRDTGTVVFPGAEVKFFLDAALEERARRRHRELLERGKEVSYEEVLEDLKRRDMQDSTREVAPLRVPDGAFYIDSTHLTPEEVLAIMLDRVRNAL